MGNRKEEILIVALHLFARDGYEAVSVSQIAGELDMTKGALYRHYKSKRDIFDCIVQRMEQQDSEQARQNEVPEESIEKVPEEYQNVSVEDFVGYSKSMFEYWTEDDFASSFRKMLTLEQFRNEEMQNLYQQYLVSGPAEYVKDLFKNMEIKNPEEEAVKFYANMFFYYSVYDGATDKTKAKCQFEYMLDKIVEEMKQAPVMNEFYITKIYSLEQYVLYKAAKKDYEKKYHLGYYYYYEGELNKAMRTLLTASDTKKAHNTATYALMARVYFEMKEYEKAESYSEKALNIQQNNVMALIVMGDLYSKDKDYKTAYRYYDKAYNRDKKSIAPAIRLAETARKLDKLDITKDIYSKILKVRSDCPQAYYNVAMTDATRKLEYLKKAVALDSNFTEGWLELSKMMIDIQNFATAKKYLAIAKYIDENNFKYYYYQGLICKSQGLMQDAIYNFKKSLSINPNFKPAKEELSI